MVVIWFSIIHEFGEQLIGSEKSQKALLQGYGSWYIAIVATVAILCSLTEGGIWIHSEPIISFDYL